MKARRVLLALLATVGVLIVCELAFGALDFGETTIGDACTTSANFDGSGVDGAVQRVALCAISGAAGEVGVSREELVLSLVPSAGGTVRWDKATINRALRHGIERASKDTAGNGLLGGVVSALLDKILADPLAWLLGQAGE